MIEIFPDIEKLNRFAAEKFIEIGSEAIEKRERFSVALSGGSTPKALFRLLAGEDFKDKIDWKSVYFFFGDERNVLPGNAESNFRMADENLFAPLEIPESQFFRWKTEFEISDKIAEDYAATLESFFRGFPKFDLIFLGMGADGHTASLFPGTKALDENEKIAVDNYVEKLGATRLTLTFPAINNAANIIFLVAGAEKAESLREVIKGARQPDKFPAQNVRPNDGRLLWLVEKEAARLL